MLLAPFDPWKGKLCTCPFKYSLNPYTGCSHSCLYCYASSYIPNFSIPRPKQNFVERLRKEASKLNPSLVMISASTDPYQPLEKIYRYTRAALNILGKRGWRILIVTKSDSVVEDNEILKEIKSAVSITITTLNKNLAKKLEPGAPSPEKRIKALEKIEVPKAIRVDPIIPALNEDVEKVIEAAASVGVKHVTFSVYKAKPDNFRRLIAAFPKFADYWRNLYFKEGEKIGGYFYAPLKERKRILENAAKIAEKYKLSWAFCREGLPFKAKSCDGSHLIPL